MLGTIVNTLAVLAGSILGLLLTAVTKKFGMKVSERFSERIMQALGLCTIYIGISGSLEGENTLVLILSMVIGTLIGEALDLDEKINRLGNFLEKKYFTLYVSAGGMVEKCVYGKLADDKVNVKPLQFSVAGAVGAQFNATDHVGLYVEPGVSYFFDDGSKVQTIRKERPCNFNLQAGLRFTY